MKKTEKEKSSTAGKNKKRSKQTRKVKQTKKSPPIKKVNSKKEARRKKKQAALGIELLYIFCGFILAGAILFISSLVRG